MPIRYDTSGDKVEVTIIKGGGCRVDIKEEGRMGSYIIFDEAGLVSLRNGTDGYRTEEELESMNFGDSVCNPNEHKEGRVHLFINSRV